MKAITCNINSKECMYRECSNCDKKRIPVNCEDEGKMLWWHEWKNRRIEKEKKTPSGESFKKTVSMTVKEKEIGTAGLLIESTNTELQKACRHVYNIRHQFRTLRHLKDVITNLEAIIHIDFSENFNCKYREEIQSMHFGASQRQISLHTGVVYMKNCTRSFCTISDCLRHDPLSIWAHLQPVLESLKDCITTVHFVSDGPTTQYRNKQNFYLLTTKIFELGFRRASWNFLEAGHGKGAADGIGAVIKRQADAAVQVRQKDITCAEDMMSVLGSLQLAVELYLVREETVTVIEKQLPENLIAVPQTMKIHQLLVDCQYMGSSRVLSCFCKHPDTCRCFEPRMFDFSHAKQTTPCVQVVQKITEPGLSTDHISDASTPSATNSTSKLVEIDTVDESLISKHCVVLYDQIPYPGVIVDVDDEDEIEVNVMHRIGRNRYFWPMMEDILWYKKSDCITLLTSPPRQVTSRHKEIDPAIWKLIEDKL